MKKLITAITALAMSAILSVTAFAATSPDEAMVLLGGAAGRNESFNNYTTFAYPVESYIEELDSGFRRIEYYDDVLTIEEYGSNLTLTSTRKITNDGYIFGGCYFGTKYNFLVWGKTNYDESDSNEVLLIEKYSKSWQTKVSSVSVYGANTQIPFRAGSLRMTETGGKLYIHGAHQMYKSSDGLNHQANMTFVVDIASMTILDSWYKVMNISYGYASHSFNQFIITDGNYIYRADHGDAYPRSVVITKCAVGDKITKVSYTDVLPISGAIGDNFTGVSIGGFEMSVNNLLIAGNTADQSDPNIGYGSMRNIFVSVTNKNLSSTSIKYLTNYTDNDDVTVQTPHLVKINDNKFLIMWQELWNHDYITRLATIDESGNLTSDIIDTRMLLSDCAPVLFSDGLVYWLTADTRGATLYRVNPFDLEAANNGAVMQTKGFSATATQNSVNLSWNVNTTASGYMLEEYVNGKWVSLADIPSNNTTSYTLNNLTPATAYRYRIRPYAVLIDSLMYGESSEITTHTTIPATQGLVLKGRASTALRFSWSANSYADGYIIEQNINDTWTAIADITDNQTTTYRIDGLESNTTYNFRIKGYFKDGNNTIYSSSSDTVAATTAPAKVSGFKVKSRTADTLQLTWNIDEQASGYIIEQYKNSKWVRLTKITDNTINTYNVTGLKGATTYKFRMRAYKDYGLSAYVGDYTGALGGTTNPSAVTGFKLGGRAADVLRLSWTTNSSATGYIIEQYINGEWIRIAKITDNTTNFYRVTNLQPSTIYKFRMKAYKMVGNVGLHGEYTKTFVATTSPSAVENLRLGGRRSTVLRLNWDKNTTADGYMIEQYKDGKWVQIAKITDKNTTTYRVTNLDPMTLYKFRMRAYKIKSGVYLYSKYTSTKSWNTSPSLVTGLRLTDVTDNSLNLCWNQNSTADGYIIEQSVYGEWVRIAKLTSKELTSYTVTGLNSNTTYKFRIKTYNMVGKVGLHGEYVNISGTTNG